MKERIYYIGIGSFGYAVFYDDEIGEPHKVSTTYHTLGQARFALRRVREGSFF
jgi:hypothetical protein